MQQTCILKATIWAPCIHPVIGLKFDEVTRVPLGYTLIMFFWVNLQNVKVIKRSLTEELSNHGCKNRDNTTIGKYLTTSVACKDAAFSSSCSLKLSLLALSTMTPSTCLKLLFLAFPA